MILDTNISKTEKIHNLLEFEPLEKQFFLFLKDCLGEGYSLSYKIKENERQIIINEKFILTITDVRKKLMTFFERDYKHYTYSLAERINANFSYNKDISKQLLQFTEKIKQIISLHEKSNDLWNWYKKYEKHYSKNIISFLNEKFCSSDNKIQTSFWLSDYRFLGGSKLRFFIYPRNDQDERYYCPGDGELLQLNPDGSCSISQREDSNQRDRTVTIDQFFKRVNYPGGIAGSKEKIKDMEDLENRIRTFNGKECPELMALLEKNNEGYVFIQEGGKIKS